MRERFEAKICLDVHCDPSIPDSNWPVNRAAEACERDLLKAAPQMPKRSQTMSLPAMVRRNLTAEETERIVLQGGNLLRKGIARMGKSHFCLNVVEKLRSMKLKVDMIPKTHTASARTTGVTADHCVRSSFCMDAVMRMSF